LPCKPGAIVVPTNCIVLFFIVGYLHLSASF
jgi:hypothetical protein